MLYYRREPARSPVDTNVTVAALHEDERILRLQLRQQLDADRIAAEAAKAADAQHKAAATAKRKLEEQRAADLRAATAKRKLEEQRAADLRAATAKRKLDERRAAEIQAAAVKQLQDDNDKIARQKLFEEQASAGLEADRSLQAAAAAELNRKRDGEEKRVAEQREAGDRILQAAAELKRKRDAEEAEEERLAEQREVGMIESVRLLGEQTAAAAAQRNAESTGISALSHTISPILSQQYCNTVSCDIPSFLLYRFS